MQVSFSILENHSFRTVEQTLNLVLFLCCLGKKLLQLMYCPINIFPIYFSLVKFIFYFLWNDSITFSSTMLSLATQRMLFRIICSRGCQIVLVERTLTVEEQTFNHDNQPTTMAMIPRGYLLILHYHMPPEWFVILCNPTLSNPLSYPPDPQFSKAPVLKRVWVHTWLCFCVSRLSIQLFLQFFQFTYFITSYRFKVTDQATIVSPDSVCYRFEICWVIPGLS